MLAIAAVLVGLGVVWWTSSVGSSSRSSQSTTVGCITWNTPDSDEQCEKAAEDRLKRQPMSDAQRDEAAPVRDDLERQLSQLGRCITAAGEPCASNMVSRAATEADVTAVLQKLNGVPLSSSTVRLARSDDPAPTGSVFYAIELPKRGCVVGHLESVPGGLGMSTVVGQLPEGGCAAP